ncbi:CDP-diacylglycerol--glycerol-3-phosphate 3-phosphatidyltransferase [Coemansia spiralis]|nr:CDP-diacylglycerol--glycerol-3-phosphate 3-phosphatidyltransferase [Coemansia spiralis]
MMHYRAGLRTLQRHAAPCATRRLLAAAAQPPPPQPASRPVHRAPPARQVFASLALERPVFPIRQPIRVLREPQEFYRELLRGISQAQRRICLSSLYLGTQETELVAALDQALARNPALEVHVLLDCLRGTRLDSAGASSATLLAPLVAAHGRDRVRVSLYHTPALSGVSKRTWPQRFNEAFGLQHIKAYVFDDSVIVSGANLSRDYFTNRQDRYMQLTDRPFADYFVGLVDAVGRVSFEVVADGAGSGGFRLAMARGVPDPSREPREFVREANDVVTRFLCRMEAEHPAGDADSLGSQGTVAIPTVQMRQLAITQDECHMNEFFAVVDQWAQQRPCRSVMASAYFNFSEHYKRALLEGHGRWDLLVASPQANGFHAARGISQFIPDMYSIIERDFVCEAARRERGSCISVEEYARTGWTFHGKGIWCYLDQQLPQLTMIGSPNYGYRSIYRDLEAQVTLIPGSDALKASIHREAQDLLAHSHPVDLPALRKRTRSAPLWLHGLRPFIQNKM